MAISMHTLRCTEKFDLDEFFEPGSFTCCSSGSDEQSSRICGINWARVQYGHFIKDDEMFITGEEKLRRQKDAGHIEPGGNVLLSLLNDYRTHGKASVLEWLYRSKHQVISLDFFGLIVQRSIDNKRSVLCLSRHSRTGGTWRLENRLLEGKFYRYNLSPVLQNALFTPKVLIESA